MQSKVSLSQHNVFIADNDGMSLLYPEILGILRDEDDKESHLTLLYFSPQRDFIFQSELSILKAHFPQRLIVFYRDKPDATLFESVLNSNTKRNIRFQIGVDATCQTEIVEQLRFLGVNIHDITLFPGGVPNP